MLVKKFLEQILKDEMIVKNDKVLVAFSGGIDSVALLNLLIEGKDLLGISIGAVHLNHGFREDADSDEVFCRSFCEMRGIPFYSRKIQVETYASTRKISFEMAGRELRYQLFEEIMREQGYTKCATAHHLDDQVETVLLNLLRGTGLKGLTGISPIRGCYIRPLLSFKKSELLAYLEKKGIEYRHDYTNDEVDYQRNRLRNEVLPYLETHFQGDVSQSISRMTKLLTEDLKFIEEEVLKASLKYLVVSHDKVRILKDVKNLPYAISSRILLDAVYRVKGNLKNIEEIHIRDLLQLFTKETGKMLDIKEGVQGRNDYGDLLIEIKKEQTERNNIMLHEVLSIPGTYTIQGKKITLRYIAREEMKKDKQLRFFNGDLIEGEILVRHKEEGDRMRPFGMNGYRKLKNILIDKKISREDREELLVFQYGKDIIYIGGMMISEDYKVREKTEKILEIGIFEEEN